MTTSAVFTNVYNPNVNVCGQCHNDRGAAWTDTSRAPHHSPQYNMLLGTVGELADRADSRTARHPLAVGNAMRGMPHADDQQLHGPYLQGRNLSALFELSHRSGRTGSSHDQFHRRPDSTDKEPISIIGQLWRHRRSCRNTEPTRGNTPVRVICLRAAPARARPTRRCSQRNQKGAL